MYAGSATHKLNCAILVKELCANHVKNSRNHQDVVFVKTSFVVNARKIFKKLNPDAPIVKTIYVNHVTKHKKNSRALNVMELCAENVNMVHVKCVTMCFVRSALTIMMNMTMEKRRRMGMRRNNFHETTTTQRQLQHQLLQQQLLLLLQPLQLLQRYLFFKQSLLLFLHYCQCTHYCHVTFMNNEEFSSIEWNFLFVWDKPFTLLF